MGKGGVLPMVGGEGRFSYMNNSTYQRGRILLASQLIKETINDKLNVKTEMGSIRIVDLGCSTGPNTIYAMEIVIHAVLKKLESLATGNHEGEMQEFQVFFNDQIGNDFNTLFRSVLELDRRFFVAGVPGSFYSRLFPRASIHYFNSSLALQWLSGIPNGAVNKGRVHCYGGGKGVVDAYVAQHRADMLAFLDARAEELVPGGLMVLQFLYRPEWMAPDAPRYDLWFQFLEPILREFVSEGWVTEEDMDSFQVPMHAPSVEEFKEFVDMNGCFDIHVSKIVGQSWGFEMDEGPGSDLEQIASYVGINARAVFERTVSDHFGDHMTEKIFRRFPGEVYQHLTQNTASCMLSPPPTVLFILHRKPYVCASF